MTRVRERDSQDGEIVILDIAVEGNHRLSQQDILRNARLFKGMPIEGPEIQQAIKRRWNLNRFGNIQILIEDETDEGIYLRIVVEENPTLGEVEYEGNKKKSTRTLDEELELTKGQILSEYVVFEAMEKIKSLYAEKNYHSLGNDTNFLEVRINNAGFVTPFFLLFSMKDLTKTWKIESKGIIFPFFHIDCHVFNFIVIRRNSLQMFIINYSIGFGFCC